MQTLTRIGFGKSYELAEYILGDSTVYGVCWNGNNWQPLKDLIGKQLEGLVNGRMEVYGREIGVGDFVYTDLPKEDFTDLSLRRNHYETIPENSIFIIESGNFQFV